MTFELISSGSKGNAVILNGSILIDCGVPYKLLEPYVKYLKMVLLTHIHGDHFHRPTIYRLFKERPTLRFVCGEWLVAPLVAIGVNLRNIDLCSCGDGSILEYDGGSLMLSAFPLVHDVENCGYRIHIDGEKAIYATDTVTMEGVVAKDYDLYMVEANFTEDELQERINRKLQTGEFIYEYQAAARHMSKERTDAWLYENATPGKSKVVYLHKHEERSH